MTDEIGRVDWDYVKRFKESEFAPPDFYPGYIVPMNPSFIRHLDEYARAYVPEEVIIHRNGGYATEGHSPNSYHYKGMAADLHVKGKGCIQVAIDAWRNSGFSIGIYPWWNTPGVHLDARYLEGKQRTFWYRKAGGEYHYSHDFPALLEQLFGELKIAA